MELNQSNSFQVCQIGIEPVACGDHLYRKILIEESDTGFTFPKFGFNFLTVKKHNNKYVEIVSGR